ncbi:hypothetical protein NQ315_003062 [Exocentrus adspersus]|uniref:Small RNA 2'-O-methyltransferase n=1 Tax=Exocentrus adspersus TaxID=1586481 RepID=A0AAV8W4M5_9CUCU|nr:hypothetical protein NQ315_003062 [Exocentrus adspersus]
MIILFHYLSFLIIKLLRDKERIKSTQNLLESNTTKPSSETNSPVVEHADLENQIKFDPPLYRQRYGSVYETLLDERWRTKVYTLVDFGCSEFGLFVFVKRLNHLSKILFVDIDEEMLRQYTGKLLPLTIDYIRRRQGPLDINVFLGSVSDPDYRLVNVDAVSAVELIEHLYPDTLDAFPYNVFQYIKPKLVMVTTPNSDFNVLFPKRDGFRHFDHKFEWSREQFQDWANNIIIRFPNYTVSFSGLGEGPAGTEHLGQCSQMAVFVRNDLIVNEYVSETCCVCICASASPCRYSSSDSKLLCSCVCALCSPSASFGVCTYLSHSKRNAEQDPKHNVYYKLIKEVDYPVDFDNRTEDEKMADELQYRISTLGRAWGRFYVEEQDRSEIPLQDVTYGANGFSITESELGKVLIRLGYKVEECRIQETGLIQTCVIYEPVMEDISDTSEASGYDSDFTKHQLNGESLSDWDEPHVKKDGAKTSSTSEDMTCLEMASREQPVKAATDLEEDKKPHDALVDSGYQKSLSLVDDSPQTPLEELEETDLFEDTTKKHGFTPPPPPDVNKFKLDFNRINEMDKLPNVLPGRTFLSHLAPPPEVFRKGFLKDKDSLPGPSSLPVRKRKKVRKSPVSDDDSPFEDVKSITNCLIENTLNKLDVKEDKQNLIEYAEKEAEAEQLEEAALEQQEEAFVDVDVDAWPRVENGDLANNNRDFEGNNYIAQEEAVENIGNDIVNDNLELAERLVEQLPLVHEENDNADNNNGVNEEMHVIQDPFVIVAEEVNVENAENGQAAADVLGQASREVLFDANSEQDSLDDFDIPSPLHDLGGANAISNVVFVGVHPTPEDNETEFPEDEAFPLWLLQILGTQVIVEGDIAAAVAGTAQEEPHFYCQGDGLGVHPSVIAVEVDEEEDTTDSSNNTTDFAEVEQGLSTQDVSSLHDESSGIPMENQEHEGEEQPETEQHEHLGSSSSMDPGGSA